MNNLFSNAFSSIHATEEMKQKTCEFLHNKIASQSQMLHSHFKYAANFFAVIAVVLCGISGYGFYFSPVSFISVDVNPSMELGLNRLDRVVSITAYNDDGAAILQNLSLKNKTYIDAIELILANDTFESYLTEDSLLSFTVVSKKDDEILSVIKQSNGYKNANSQCHSAEAQLVEDAHHNGLSFGKYQAFLELSQYDKTITVEDCKNLSMRQIKDLISQYQLDTNPPSFIDEDNMQKNYHHGKNRHGQ